MTLKFYKKIRPSHFTNQYDPHILQKKILPSNFTKKYDPQILQKKYDPQILQKNMTLHFYKKI